MRSLIKNKRSLYYSNVLGYEDIPGTLEKRRVYSDPILLDINISANVSEEATEVFGSLTDYSRTLSTYDVNCPLKEGTRLWVNEETTNQYNYEVVKVADSKNGLLIAIREVASS